jgi:bifunctional non-homologous end joining protein LigD
MRPPAESAEPLRPQLATTQEAIVQSVDWLFEPFWRGDRLLARVRRASGTVQLTDETGSAADHAFAEVADVLRHAIDAEEVVLDGVWTAQPFVGSGSPAQAWASTIAEEGLTGEVPDPIENERRRAFVVVDVLELDGQVLHEIPFQERRRLLASLVDEAVQLRLSPAVKIPADHWIAAWRQSGFSHYVAKHVNSRYLPGEVNEDWIIMPTTPEAPPSIIGRFFGQRPRKLRRIEDIGPGEDGSAGG